MTHREQSGAVPRKKTESIGTAVDPVASPPMLGVSLFDPWGALESLSRLSGLLVLSPERSHAWTRNWAVLWGDQVRRWGFYLKWPIGLG